jgi:hypothetical protein
MTRENYINVHPIPVVLIQVSWRVAMICDGRSGSHDRDCLSREA